MANEFRASLQDFIKTIDPNGEFGWLKAPLEELIHVVGSQLISGEQFFKLCMVLTEAKDEEVAEHERS